MRMIGGDGRSGEQEQILRGWNALYIGVPYAASSTEATTRLEIV